MEDFVEKVIVTTAVNLVAYAISSKIIKTIEKNKNQVVIDVTARSA